MAAVFASYVVLDAISNNLEYDVSWNFTNLEQILNDWEKELITDIKLFPREEGKPLECPKGYKALFTKTWKGLDKSCSCEAGWTKTTALDFAKSIQVGRNCPSTCTE